jgi:hypothetical protein
MNETHGGDITIITMLQVILIQHLLLTPFNLKWQVEKFKVEQYKCLEYINGNVFSNSS